MPRFPALATAVSPDLTFVPVRSDGDSWAGRVHLIGLLVNDDHQVWDPSQPWTATSTPSTSVGEFGTERRDVELPTAIVYHDSFGMALRGSLPCAFSSASFVRSLDFPSDRIERERPDVVIQVVAERFLMRPAWSILGGELDADLMGEIAQSHGTLARFDASELVDRCELRGPIEAVVVQSGVDGAGVHGSGVHGAGLEVRETRPGGLLILPEIASNAAAPLVLRFDVQSEIATTLSACGSNLVDRR